jgi:hypothetical protein
MSFIKSKHFYQAYFLEFWSHKLSLINHSYHNIEEVYPKVENGLPVSTKDLFSSYLKVEIHTTYYSLVETLFTLVYLLNTGNEKDLWCRLGKDKNFINKLDSIAKPLSKGNFHFFEKSKKKRIRKISPIFRLFIFQGNRN